MSKLRPSIRNLLKGNPSIFHYTSFETADQLFSQHPIWQQARIESERRELFLEYLTELQNREQVSLFLFIANYSEHVFRPVYANSVVETWKRLSASSRLTTLTPSPDGEMPSAWLWNLRNGRKMLNSASCRSLTFCSPSRTLAGSKRTSMRLR